MLRIAGMVSYAASKSALESYTRSAATDLGRYGVTVNTVSPGPTQTGYITPGGERRVLARIPMGRLGTADDIAAMVVFLASDQAGWVTGQLVQVGGGKVM